MTTYTTQTLLRRQHSLKQSIEPDDVRISWVSVAKWNEVWVGLRLEMFRYHYWYWLLSQISAFLLIVIKNPAKPIIHVNAKSIRVYKTVILKNDLCSVQVINDSGSSYLGIKTHYTHWGTTNGKNTKLDHTNRGWWSAIFSDKYKHHGKTISSILVQLMWKWTLCLLAA